MNSNAFVKDNDTWKNVGFIHSVRMSLPPNPLQCVNPSDVTVMSIVPSRSGMFTKVAPNLRDAYVAGQKKAIPSYDQLSRRQSEELIKLLSEEYNIPPPQLKWRTRSKRGRYNSRKNIISAGPNVWRGLTNCLLHEFAHALTHFVSPTASAHGDEFVNHLWDVVKVWHDDPSLYAWPQEYKAVAKKSVKLLATWTAKHEQTFAIAAERAEVKAYSRDKMGVIVP